MISPQLIKYGVITVLVVCALAYIKVQASVIDSLEMANSACLKEKAEAQAKLDQCASANRFILQTSKALQASAQIALSRQEELQDIFVCPSGEPVQSELTHEQSEKLIDYWNNLFSEFGLRPDAQ